MNAVRIGIAVMLVWFAVYGIEARKHDVPVDADAPPAAILDKLGPVAAALKHASVVDRALWAEVWSKSAKVVAGDNTTGADIVFTETRSLRAFTVLSLDIAWHRIAGNQPGKYSGLREAVEAFLADSEVLGRDDVPLTPEVRTKYIDAANALAWAGMNRG